MLRHLRNWLSMGCTCMSSLALMNTSHYGNAVIISTTKQKMLPRKIEISNLILAVTEFLIALCVATMNNNQDPNASTLLELPFRGPSSP